MQIHGADVPKPIRTFAEAGTPPANSPPPTNATPYPPHLHAGFDAKLLAAIAKVGFDKPTPIQAQALPAVLMGRDVIGIAKTGSGKTLAFVWPLLVHLMDQVSLHCTLAALSNALG